MIYDLITDILYYNQYLSLIPISIPLIHSISNDSFSWYSQSQIESGSFTLRKISIIGPRMEFHEHHFGVNCIPTFS